MRLRVICFDVVAYKIVSKLIFWSVLRGNCINYSYHPDTHPIGAAINGIQNDVRKFFTDSKKPCTSVQGFPLI
ncbi:Uncharacterised protein [Buttiauxella agrestis]|uniref:Uncharacterized protein n=1 Tax=Buttiauxella agrestis TaxID=82977 RepID=A0A381C3Y6_9ENTR|nr:Uncharacterised protein [Buttiauxella agrestis]